MSWSGRGDGDGCEGDRPVSGAMADRGQGSASADDSGADSPGTVVRHLAAGPGLDGSGDGGGAGTGPPHHREMGGGIGRGWVRRLDLRADRGFPRPWRNAAGGVEGGGAGIARRVGHWLGQLELESGLSVRLGTLRYQPEPRQLPELSAPAGVCL